MRLRPPFTLTRECSTPLAAAPEESGGDVMMADDLKQRIESDGLGWTEINQAQYKSLLRPDLFTVPVNYDSYRANDVSETTQQALRSIISPLVTNESLVSVQYQWQDNGRAVLMHPFYLCQYTLRTYISNLYLFSTP